MKNQTITLQKTVYISGQDRLEGACVQLNSNFMDVVHHEIMSDKKLERKEQQGKNKWDYYPDYETKGVNVDFYDYKSWNGLRKIFPYVDRDKNIECLVTVIFESKDVESWEEDCVIDSYTQEKELYNFHAESDYYVVETRYDDFMLCKNENSLYWEIDDGYIKWDCHRENGGLIFDNSPLLKIFPHSKYDGHSVNKPYKCRIIVDAII